MNEIDYAWAAGFWDGEGSVSTTLRPCNGNVRIVVQASQVDREVLDKFCRVMEMGKVLGPYKQKNTRAQDYYCWRVEGSPHLDEFRDKLYRHLGTQKKNQIDYALTARAEWEATSVCNLGHKLEKSPKGQWYCKKCRSDQGKIRAALMWAEKDKVIL